MKPHSNAASAQPAAKLLPLRDVSANPRSGDFIARARELAPLIRAKAAQGEADRRVSQEVVDALEKSGLLKLAVPKRYGGYETSMRTILEVTAAIAEADGSTAWVTTIMTGSSWLVSLFPTKAQDEVFGENPNAKVSGVISPTSETVKVKGGWRVTGRWFWNSGSWFANWAVLAIPITDEKGEVVDQGLALVSTKELEIEDTWFVAGMKSTASNCLIAKDVFVPEYRVMSVPAAMEGHYPSEHKNEVLYRSSFVPILSLILVGPLLGLGKAALSVVREKASKKAISYTFFETQKDSVAFQLQLAEAAMLLDTAWLHALRSAEDIDEGALKNTPLDLYVRARIKADSGYIAQKITQAIDILLYAHGAGSFADANILQRIWRDASTAARHGTLTPSVGYETLGKVLLDMPERITPMV